MTKVFTSIGCIDCGEYIMILAKGEVINARCPECSKKWLDNGNTLVNKPMGELE